MIGALDEAPGEQQLVIGETAGPAQEHEARHERRAVHRGAPAGHRAAASPCTRSTRTSAATTAVEQAATALAARDCPEPHTIWITETGVGPAPEEYSGVADPAAAGCRDLHDRLVQWFNDPRVTVAFQYTVREDDKFPVGLFSTDVTEKRPALAEWQTWGGGSGPPRRRPRPPAELKGPVTPARGRRLALPASSRPACARSQSASDVKPTITPSIQYCERTASLASPYMVERPVVREREGGDVADDDHRDLDVPRVLLREDRVVDAPVDGAEEVPALPERVAGQVGDRLALEDEEREVVRGDVDGRDRHQRVDEAVLELARAEVPADRSGALDAEPVEAPDEHHPEQQAERLRRS